MKRFANSELQCHKCGKSGQIVTWCCLGPSLDFILMQTEETSLNIRARLCYHVIITSAAFFLVRGMSVDMYGKGSLSSTLTFMHLPLWTSFHFRNRS